MLVEDVLPDELRPLELLAAEGTQPLVLGELLGVGLDELLNLGEHKGQSRNICIHTIGNIHFLSTTQGDQCL